MTGKHKEVKKKIYVLITAGLNHKYNIFKINVKYIINKKFILNKYQIFIYSERI